MHHAPRDGYNTGMAAFQRSPAERLATPVKFLKGVGPPREALFEKLGLLTARDVLFYFPRDYEDLTQFRTIAELEDGKMASVRGQVVEVDQRTSEGGRIVTGVLLNQGNDHLRAVWFNQPYMTPKFRHGQCVLLSGVAKQWGLMWEMTHPAVQWLDEAADEPARGKMLPVYPLCEGLKQRHVRRAVENALAEYVNDLDEVFPAEFLEQHKLLPLRQALPQLHFPESAEHLEQARRRFVYQELLLLQLGLALRRMRQRQGRSPLLAATAQIDARIRRLFPF